MIATPELNVPPYPPDISDVRVFRGYAANLWLPTDGQSGLLVTSDASRPSATIQPELVADMSCIALTMHQPTRLHALYNYLGVYYDYSSVDGTVTRSASFADPAFVNDRLAALDMPQDHRPPLVASWEGERYPAEEAAEELVRSGRFLVATEGRGAMYDMVVNFTLAQVLMRPDDIDRLASQAKHALWETSTTQAFMDKLALYLSSVSLGRHVAKAFVYEQRLEDERNPRYRQQLATAVERSWQRAGDAYADLMATPPSEVQLDDLREHYLVLNEAARQHLPAAM